MWNVLCLVDVSMINCQKEDNPSQCEISAVCLLSFFPSIYPDDPNIIKNLFSMFHK